MPKKTTPYRVNDFPKKPRNLKKPKKTVRWAMDEPKREERIQMYQKCPKCILVPPKAGDDRSDVGNYKFPVCTKLGKTKGKCQFNCTGILAANRRARLTKMYPKVVALTSKLIEKWQCTKKAEMEAGKKKIVKRKPLQPKKKPKVVIKKKVMVTKKTTPKKKTKKTVPNKTKKVVKKTQKMAPVKKRKVVKKTYTASKSKKK
jgi:hypothetical protein